MSTLVIALADVLLAVDKPPSEDEIGAGWWYLVLFIFLAAAVALLGFSLTKQLRRTRDNADAGVFGKDEKKP